MPEQVQLHGPLPLTLLGAPLAQSPEVGTEARFVFAALPQVPSIELSEDCACVLAAQETVTPPPAPLHDHVQGPLP